MTLKVLLVASAAFLATVSALPEGIRAQDDACSMAVANANAINAKAIFEGAVACARAENLPDTHFLLILGQIRGLSDMTILEPLNEANAQHVGELYSMIFYQFGGLGSPDFYRTPANVDVLEQRLRETDLSFFENYNPGWSFKPTSKIDIYAQYLANVREKRIWEMRNHALLWQNDRYFELSQARDKLQRDNPTFQAGSAAYDEFLQLTAEMDEIAGTIPQLPEPEDTTPYVRLHEPDPDMANLQVAAGFNGPATQGFHIYRSEAEVRQSWLATALTDPELQTLLSKVDFASDLLVGFSYGQMRNASGPLIVANIEYIEINRGYRFETSIGVIPESCDVDLAESYPFVFGIIKAVEGAEVNTSGMSTFPVECGPIMSGTPATQP